MPVPSVVRLGALLATLARYEREHPEAIAGRRPFRSLSLKSIGPFLFFIARPGTVVAELADRRRNVSLGAHDRRAHKYAHVTHISA